MIVVTGGEPSLGAVASRIDSLGPPLRHEVRVDLLRKGRPADLSALPHRHRLLVTCRRAEEGGAHRGSDAAQRAWLEAALEAGVWAVDLEAAAPDTTWEALNQRYGAGRLVASAHWFRRSADEVLSPDVLERRCQRLAARPAAVLKLAVTLLDVAELRALRELRPPDARPLVRIGMGLAGQASRVAYRAMGSPWTYAAAEPAAATAPGQLPVAVLGRPAAAEPGLLVLLGGEQVRGSPGPRVYTDLATRMGLPWVYLAAPTQDLPAALSALAPLGLKGASVTMPHKAAAGRISRLEGFAARVGVVNTLVPRPGKPAYAGHNTDGEGVLGALAPHLPAGGKPARVLVLGAGGAARAAALALAEVGHRVAVSSRRPEAAAALARAVAGVVVPWSERGRAAFDVLVNATPVGAQGQESPMPPKTRWTGRVVLDMVLAAAPTPLLRAVSQGGGTPVPGLHMWAHQGAAQWALFTGQRVPPATLLECAQAALTASTSAAAPPPATAPAPSAPSAPAAEPAGAGAAHTAEAPGAASRAAERLVLVGPRGAGKTVCGQAVAARLGVPFVDLDAEIEARGESIAALFARGEAVFRAVERDVLAQLDPARRAVIATGGGAVLSPENRARLRALGTVVYLTAAPEVLAERVAGSDRPPLLDGGPLREAREILAVRDPLYREVADHVLGTDRLGPAEVAERLVALLRRGP